MESNRYPVFVDQKTATEKGITEAPGRPEHEDGKPLGGAGVFVGFTPETTTYALADWPNLTEGQRAFIMDTANRQIVQDAKNLYRADVKSGRDSAKTQAEVADLAAKAGSGDADAIAELVRRALKRK